MKAMELGRVLTTERDDAGHARHSPASRMDIALVLNDTTDTSGGSTDDDDAMRVTPAPARTTKITTVARRRKTVSTVTTLRAQVEALELALANWPSVLGKKPLPSDDEESGSDSKNVKAKSPLAEASNERMREYLRRMMLLYTEGQREQEERGEILRLLKPYYELHSALSRLTRGAGMSTWSSNCERWTAMGDACYVPLTHSEYLSKKQKLLDYIKNYKSPGSKNRQDEDLFGWAETSVTEGQDYMYVHAHSRRTAYLRDFKQVHVNCWEMLHSREQTLASFYPPNTDYFHRVLQVISPDASVIHTVKRGVEEGVILYFVQLVFRIRTPTKTLIVASALDSPQLEGMMKLEGLYRISTVYWSTWEALAWDANGECNAYTVATTACFCADHPSYARGWANPTNHLVALVRTERQISPDSTNAGIVLR